MARMAQKIPTSELKQLDGMNEYAGRCAARDAWPWQAGMAWAAATEGTTDAVAVAATYAEWLRGWLAQAGKMSGEPPPDHLIWLQENLTQVTTI